VTRLSLLLRLLRCYEGETDNVRKIRLGLLVLKLGKELLQ
jgi:hypothetical protein